MIRPLGATCFVTPDGRDRRSAGGLSLPTIVQDDACTGVVTAIGAGVWLRRRGPTLVPFTATDDVDVRVRAVRRVQPVQVGDRIVYAPERARIVPFGYGAAAPVHVLLDARDVLAILPSDATAPCEAEGAYTP